MCHLIVSVLGLQRFYISLSPQEACFLLKMNEKPVLANPVHPNPAMLQGGVLYSYYVGEN